MQGHLCSYTLAASARAFHMQGPVAPRLCSCSLARPWGGAPRLLAPRAPRHVRPRRRAPGHPGTLRCPRWLRPRSGRRRRRCRYAPAWTGPCRHPLHAWLSPDWSCKTGSQQRWEYASTVMNAAGRVRTLRGPLAALLHNAAARAAAVRLCVCARHVLGAAGLPVVGVDILLGPRQSHW